MIDLTKKMEQAIKGTISKDKHPLIAYDSCTVICGTALTPDGREAQITISAQTDKTQWMDENETDEL